jgi:hypothetical protein
MGRKLISDSTLYDSLVELFVQRSGYSRYTELRNMALSLPGEVFCGIEKS